jgi:Spy/CpxP family protein refolding chaperone
VEGPKMVWQRLAVTAFMILALTSRSLLPAQEKGRPGKETDRLDALALKLKFSDAQKEQVKKIYADFDKKADPLVRQLCTQRGEEWEALQKMLNDGQKKKLKEVIEAQAAKELQAVAEKLNLTEEQKGKVKKIRQDFWEKFLSLSIKNGENMAREYRELHMDVVLAGRQVLTPEQCTKLHAIQKQDFDDWHDFIYRPEHLKAIGQQLGLNAEPLKQLQEVFAGHEKKLEQSKTKIRDLCKEECAALDKVLNAEQKAVLHEVFPLNFLQDHP